MLNDATERNYNPVPNDDPCDDFHGIMIDFQSWVNWGPYRGNAHK
jgi:hypothetical protein